MPPFNIGSRLDAAIQPQEIISRLLGSLTRNPWDVTQCLRPDSIQVKRHFELQQNHEDPIFSFVQSIVRSMSDQHRNMPYSRKLMHSVMTDHFNENLGQLCDPRHNLKDFSFYFLRHILNLSSNYLLNFEEMEALFYVIVRGRKLWDAEILSALPPLPLSIFLDQLLVIAAGIGSPEELYLLIQREADVNTVFYRKTALCAATRTLNLQMVQILLEAGADPNAHEDIVYMTP